MLDLLLLQLLVKVAGGAGDIDAAGDAAFAVLRALDDAGWFAALRTIRGFRGIHLFFAIGCLCNLGHDDFSCAARVQPNRLNSAERFRFCMSISGLDPRFQDGEADGTG